MRAIRRKVVTTKCKVTEFKDGQQIELEPLIIYHLDNDSAEEISKREIKLLRKKYPDKNAIITNVEVTREVRAMSFEKFMEQSEVINEKEDNEQ